MILIKVGAASLNQTPLDWAHNRNNIIASIEQAKKQGITVLCLPELCITGYGCEDAFLSPRIAIHSLNILQEIKSHTSQIAVSVGLPFRYGNTVFNGAAMLIDGRIIGIVAKQNLPGDGVHYEPRWFKPWPYGVCGEIVIGDENIPVGDLMFKWGDVKIGFEICEDAWVANRPGKRLAQSGVDIILNPSASHFSFGKHEVRKRFVLEGSRSFHTTYVYANLLGNDSGRIIYDGDTLIATGGILLAASKRFSFRDLVISEAVVDIETTRMKQAGDANITFTKDNLYNNIIEIPESYKRKKYKLSMPVSGEEILVKEEEFVQVLALGLFDYLRKSFSKGFVVSLSGGADSSTIVVLISCMVEYIVKEIGVDGLRKKLYYMKDEIGDNYIDICSTLLTCIYQSTENSSETTRGAACKLAKAVGAQFYKTDVQSIVDKYHDFAEDIIKRKPNWQDDDIAMQNIQARVRAPGIWMIANMLKALLVSTSNRSEAAVGYATMDGDTSGGISPIAGIDKVFLRQWLVWMEKKGPKDLAPISALCYVNRQQPTAELRPKSNKQTDEEDLMPYIVLDRIERLAIRDKKFPLEIFDMLCMEYENHEILVVANWVSKFFKLWCRNQWKRERYAPSFHLDDENLDPKTYCRFPILSGGFAYELGEVMKKAEELSKKSKTVEKR